MTLNNLKKNHLRVYVSGAELSTPTGRLSIYSFLKFRASWNVPPWSWSFLAPADVGEPDLWFRMQLQRDRFSCQELMQPLTRVFFFPSSPHSRVTLSPHPQLLSPTALTPSERRVPRCCRPLCCFACCTMEGEPWQADSWLPRCPLWSAVCLRCHCGGPACTQTGYSGPKFQHPSVKANKRYLKGQQNPGQRHRLQRGQPASCLFGNWCGCCFCYMCICCTWNISQVRCVWVVKWLYSFLSTKVGVD